MAIPTITKDFGEIVGRGGNDVQVSQVNDDGTEIVHPNTWSILGHVLTSQPIGALPREAVQFEDGSEQSSHSNEEVGATIQLAQDIDFEALIREVRGKFYILYWNKGTYSSLVREEVALCQIFVNSAGSQRPGAPGGPTLEFRYMKAPAAITLDDTGTSGVLILPSTATSTSMVIAAGSYYKRTDS